MSDRSFSENAINQQTRACCSRIDSVCLHLEAIGEKLLEKYDPDWQDDIRVEELRGPGLTYRVGEQKRTDEEGRAHTDLLIEISNGVHCLELYIQHDHNLELYWNIEAEKRTVDQRKHIYGTAQQVAGALGELEKALSWLDIAQVELADR